MTRNEGGYTLAEMLAALIVIGLVIGGLTQGVRLLSRYQSAATTEVEHNRDLVALQMELEHVLATPADVSQLQGDGASLRLPCPTASGCGAVLARDALVITGEAGRTVVRGPARGLQFAYEAGDGRHERWPIAGPNAPALLGVSVLTAASPAELPIAFVRVHAQEQARCDYDVIILACRQTGP